MSARQRSRFFRGLQYRRGDDRFQRFAHPTFVRGSARKRDLCPSRTEGKRPVPFASGRSTSAEKRPDPLQNSHGIIPERIAEAFLIPCLTPSKGRVIVISRGESQTEKRGSDGREKPKAIPVVPGGNPGFPLHSLSRSSKVYCRIQPRGFFHVRKSSRICAEAGCRRLLF